MPRIRKPSNMGEPFGVRLTTDALVSVDELADVWKVNRQEALRRIVDAGLAACGRSDGPPGVSATLDLMRLASEAARGAAEAVIAAGSGARGAQGAQGAQGAPERRAPDSKPLPGGHRKAPPADPPERRETSRRLTDADVGRWVREGDDARRYAHKMTRLRTGGTADTACGLAVDLRFAALSDDGRRCPKCGAP